MGDTRESRPERYSYTGTHVAALKPGESATFSRYMDVGDTDAPGRIAKSIGSYIARHHPGESFEYESFTAITAQGNPIAGVIVTRRVS